MFNPPQSYMKPHQTMIALNHRGNTSTLGIPEESAGLKLPVSRNGHPIWQFAEMMSRSSVISGISLLIRSTDFRFMSHGLIQ